MLNISVCDDDVKILDQIEEMVSRCCMNAGRKAMISRYTSSEEFFEKASIEQIDILFLDIQMQEIHGLGVAGEVRKINDYAELIFVTGYDEYMRRLFPYNVTDYLSKPIDEKEFNVIFDRAREKIFKKGEKFCYRSGRQGKNILKRDILFLSSSSHNILIHAENGKCDSYIGKLEDAREQLLEPNFVQVSNSYTINMDKLKLIDLEHVVLINGTEIEISRAYKDHVMKVYMQYINRKIM